MNNFKCTHCKHEFTVSRYSFSCLGGVTTYKVNGKAMQCPECGKADGIEAIKQPEGGICANFARIGSMGIEQKREELRKRANAHSKKQADHTRHINRNFNGRNYSDLV